MVGGENFRGPPCDTVEENVEGAHSVEERVDSTRVEQGGQQLVKLVARVAKRVSERVM